MTKYNRQVWTKNEWQGQETSDTLFFAQHRNEDGYIRWGIGENGYVGVDEGGNIYRIVQEPDNWIVEAYNPSNCSWKRYGNSSAKDWKFLAKAFVDGTTAFLPPTEDDPGISYGVTRDGMFMRIRRE